MQKIISSFMAVAVVGSMLTPVASFAQGTGTSSTDTLLQQIAALLKQLNTLQAQVDALKSEQKEVAGDIKDAIKELRSEMEPGSKGEMVEVLQAMLAADPEIYPEGLITGYFGMLTKKAVQKFQKKHGLAQPGRVGPLTLKKLNELLKKNPVAFETATSTDGNHDNGDDNSGKAIGKKNRLCAVVPPGHLIAPGWLKKNGENRPVILACQVLPRGIEKKLNATSTATSTPDVTAPVISGISASASTTSATVSWTTNEVATGKVYWSAASPVDVSATSTASTAHFGTGTSHSVNVAGLTASTVYYYVVESSDASGNKANSTQATFTTASLPPADTTAPVISGASVTASSTNAAAAFTTNEAATGKIYYGTATPLSLTATSTLSVTGSSGVTSHSIPFSGLTASTTYYYVIEAKDAASNTAVLTESSFVTTQ
ncbi:MAG: fibronectin type III domain-containing protein [Candidatus Liptonbacteria bacterium]|nr:fibronectin type III domain-containing protein [Candidatus Liptonbacteria bacterium]